jgi:hypothetical protein
VRLIALFDDAQQEPLLTTAHREDPLVQRLQEVGHGFSELGAATQGDAVRPAT